MARWIKKNKRKEKKSYKYTLSTKGKQPEESPCRGGDF